MTGRRILPSLLMLLASGLVVWFLLTIDSEVPLVPLEEAPRPPVTAEPRTLPLVLSGLREQLPETGNELRKRRNKIAEAYHEAIDAWRQGRASFRNVERIEQLLWVARAKVGEIDEEEMHRHLAELFAREHKRLVLLHENGLAGEDQLERSALYVARERHLAGLPIEDSEGRDYDAVRTDYLDRWRRRQETLVEAGLAHREEIKVEQQQLEREFPAP